MAFGLGILSLSSREFWMLSFLEFEAALDGYRRSQGDGGEQTLSGADVRDLQAAMSAAEAKDRANG